MQEQEIVQDRAAQELANLISCSMHSIASDIVKHAGLTRYRSSPFGATTRSINGHEPQITPPIVKAVQFQLERIVNSLRTGAPGPRAEASTAAAIGATTATFLRNR